MIFSLEHFMLKKFNLNGHKLRFPLKPDLWLSARYEADVPPNTEFDFSG